MSQSRSPDRMRSRTSPFHVPALGRSFTIGVALIALIACDEQPGGGPALGQVSDQTTTLGEPITVPLVIVSDNVATLAVSAMSSDQQVLPSAGIQVIGGGTNRSLLLSPSHAQTGSSTLKVVVKDSSGEASREFDLEVVVPFSGGHAKLETPLDVPTGYALDIEDETIATSGNEEVWVFDLEDGEWVEVRKVTTAPSGIALILDYGWSIDLEGARLLIGAPETAADHTGQGVAFLYERTGDTFPEDAHFFDNDPAKDERFGYSVAINGDQLFIGVPFGSTNDIKSGVVNLYQTDMFGGWDLFGKLAPSDATTGTSFGRVMAASPEVLVIGDYSDDERGADAGAAYLFVPDGALWVEAEKLAPAGLEAGDQFGHDVAASDGWVLVSAWDDDEQGEDAGAVYVFHDSGGSWEQADVLYAPDAEMQSGFGSAVAIDYPYAVVGAHLEDSEAHNAGAVYVFRHDGDTWHHLVKLTSPAPAAESAFGWDVAIDGGHLVVSQFKPGFTVVYERMPGQ